MNFTDMLANATSAPSSMPTLLPSSAPSTLPTLTALPTALPTPFELPIVRDIASKPELYELVDELYFEYHFWFDDLNFGWDSQRGGKNYVEDTVDDAMALMSQLRRNGVRAHWWI